jgi:hypothetical protein
MVFALFSEVGNAHAKFRLDGIESGGRKCSILEIRKYKGKAFLHRKISTRICPCDVSYSQIPTGKVLLHSMLPIGEVGKCPSETLRGTEEVDQP